MINIKYLHNKQGFSLVELLIVVALIAILVSIATPGILAQRPKWHIKGTTRDVASKLMLARIKAVQENTDYVLVFNQSSSPNTYTLYKADVTGNDYAISGSLQGFGKARGVASVSGCKNIIFHPNGKVLGVTGASTKCTTGMHGALAKYYIRIQAVGSIFDPMYIYLTSYTGNIVISDDAPVP